MITPDKFTIKGQEVIQSAQRLTLDHGNQQVEPEHLCLAMLADKDGLVGSILKKFGISSQGMRKSIQEEIDRFPKVTGGIGQVYISQELNKLLEKSLKESEKLKDEYYSLSGWNIKTGIPTKKKLDDLDLKNVAVKLEKLGKL